MKVIHAAALSLTPLFILIQVRQPDHAIPESSRQQATYRHLIWALVEAFRQLFIYPYSGLEKIVNAQIWFDFYGVTLIVAKLS